MCVITDINLCYLCYYRHYTVLCVLLHILPVLCVLLQILTTVMCVTDINQCYVCCYIYYPVLCMLLQILTSVMRVVTDINECLSSPCQNGGQCSNSIGEFQCNCPLLYTGETCGLCKLQANITR